MQLNFYRPQTKFGARNYFQKRLSFCSRWGVYASRTVCLQGGLHPGGGGSAYGGGVCTRVRPNPTTTEKRAVLILLECFLINLKTAAAVHEQQQPNCEVDSSERPLLWAKTSFLQPKVLGTYCTINGY